MGCISQFKGGTTLLKQDSQWVRADDKQEDEMVERRYDLATDRLLLQSFVHLGFRSRVLDSNTDAEV